MVLGCGAVLSPVAHGACPQGAPPTNAGDIVETVADIEASLAKADSARFGEAQRLLDAQLACLEELLPRFTVASLHRAKGLRAFTERNPDDATASFAAARAISPDYTFPDDFLPAAHPIRAAYDQAVASDDGTERLPRPARGTALWVDGRVSDERPMGRAAWVQLVGEDGLAKQSSYLAPADPMPTYEAGPSEPIEPRPAGDRPRKGLLVGGGAGLAVAGGLYAVAATRRAAWSSAAVEDKARLRSQTNTWAAVSGVVGLSAVGLGVVAFVDGTPGIRLTW